MIRNKEFSKTRQETLKDSSRKIIYQGHRAQKNMSRIITHLRNANQSLNELTSVHCSVTQLCPTLYNPMDSSSSVSSVHGIFQAKILEWVAISFSRGFSQLRDQTCATYTAGRCFSTEPPGKPRWVNNRILLRWLKFERLTISSVSKYMKQLEFSYIVDEKLR